jgi:hypothetical protein
MPLSSLDHCVRILFQTVNLTKTIIPCLYGRRRMLQKLFMVLNEQCCNGKALEEVHRL